ncbi:iron ABC transporter permease [Corallococcus exiguus]|uniref:ABC transporter permease n=1 Tax=Corallococcus TaxID=83461 RepID=UPI000EA1683D|nr:MULTISPECIES: iron ABC transporter permease [Corallococcus]NRD53962.1 iron ABC transporter permease [Corallococcus exiguus]NRD60551.1 iron ABC transporter permease [Corallococcus exiguus]RKH24843.1 iron ABC transporter permease [Corallococcus sp. CA041A]
MRGRWIALALWLVPLLLFAVVPVVALLVRGVGAATGGLGSVLAAESGALVNTLGISLGATAWALCLGAPLAFLLFRTDLPLRGAFTVLFTLPSAIPAFIWGMGWLSLASPRAGYLNRMLGADVFDLYGAAGIAFVEGLSGLPLVLLAGAAALRRVDPALEEAARVCGASPLRAVLNTTVPLVMPALLSGAVMVFLMAASSFGVPYLLGVSASPPTRVLTTRIYELVLLGSEEGLPRASVLASFLLLLTPLALGLTWVLGRSGRVRLSAGKGVSPRVLALGTWRTAALAGVGLVGGVLVVLPLAAILLTSLQRSFGAALTWDALTLSHWSGVLWDARTLRATGRSVLLAAGAGLLVVGLGLAGALLRRAFRRGGAAVEAMAVWPFAVPGTVLALALLVAFSRDWRLVVLDRVAFVLVLAHTPWLMLVGYVGKYLALGERNSSEALAQVDPSLAEAARVGGAGPVRAFVDATLPLLRPALVVAFVLAFLACATEITLSVLLVPAGSEVLGTLLFELQSYADPAAAAVLACAFVALVVAGQAVLAWARRRVPEVR